MYTLETCDESRIEALKGRLASMGKVAVAFSGGVDSTFLLWAAHEALGDDAVALMAVSPLVPAFELRDAEYAAEDIGVRLVKVEADPLSAEEVRTNAPERCYVCKQNMFSLLLEAGRREGANAVVEGTNADDAQAHRPGAKALAELGVESPLRDLGFTKDEVRAALRSTGLGGWDKPSCSCLATRVQYGQPIDEGLLSRIDKAEAFLRSMDFEQCRVRVHGGIARIEVMPGQIARITEPTVRRELVEQMRRLGFDYMTLDLEGFRSGSMDAALCEGGEC